MASTGAEADKELDPTRALVLPIHNAHTHALHAMPRRYTVPVNNHSHELLYDIKPYYN